MPFHASCSDTPSSFRPAHDTGRLLDTGAIASFDLVIRTVGARADSPLTRFLVKSTASITAVHDLQGSGATVVEEPPLDVRDARYGIACASCSTSHGVA